MKLLWVDSSHEQFSTTKKEVWDPAAFWKPRPMAAPHWHGIPIMDRDNRSVDDPGTSSRLNSYQLGRAVQQKVEGRFSTHGVKSSVMPSAFVGMIIEVGDYVTQHDLVCPGHFHHRGLNFMLCYTAWFLPSDGLKRSLMVDTSLVKLHCCRGFGLRFHTLVWDWAFFESWRRATLQTCWPCLRKNCRISSTLDSGFSGTMFS